MNGREIINALRDGRRVYGTMIISTASAFYYPVRRCENRSRRVSRREAPADPSSFVYYHCFTAPFTCASVFCPTFI